MRTLDRSAVRVALYASAWAFWSAMARIFCNSAIFALWSLFGTTIPPRVVSGERDPYTHKRTDPAIYWGIQHDIATIRAQILFI
jgi:hypothetical protein